MIRFLVFGMLGIVIGHRAIAFHQQPLQRRNYLSQGFIATPNKEHCAIDRIYNEKQITHGKRKFGWRERYASVQDDLEVEEMVEADQDPDEEEDANFQNDEEVERFFAEAERDANRRNFPKGKPYLVM